MQKLPIPQTDWTNEAGYVLMLLCCPNDAAWVGTVRGRIYELAVGRTWDERTGTVTAAQAIGEEIWQSMATCKLDDLVLAVETLNTTLAGFDNSAPLEQVVFELARVNYNLDRIRDNLDSHAPDGDEDTEFGLATILAALGPNATRSTEYLKNINAALNTNPVNMPDEGGEFTEGISPALSDVTGQVTGLDVTLSLGSLAVIINASGYTKVMIQIDNINLSEVHDVHTVKGLVYSGTDYPGLGHGTVRVIDQKFNILVGTY
jgi:hypothetical protein